MGHSWAPDLSAHGLVPNAVNRDLDYAVHENSRCMNMVRVEGSWVKNLFLHLGYGHSGGHSHNRVKVALREAVLEGYPSCQLATL